MTRPKSLVVDGTVILEWLFTSPTTEASEGLLDANRFALFANAEARFLVMGVVDDLLSKGQITDLYAIQQMEVFDELPLTLIECTSDLTSIALGFRKDIPACEALPLALAKTRNMTLVTADEAFAKKVSGIAGAPRCLTVSSLMTQAATSSYPRHVLTLIERIANAKKGVVLPLNVVPTGSLGSRTVKMAFDRGLIEVCDHPTVKERGSPARALRLTEEGKRVALAHQS